MCVYCKTSYIISIPKRWKKKLKDDADGAAGVTDQGKGVVEKDNYEPAPLKNSYILRL